MSTAKTASIDFRPPKRLAEHLARPGFNVRLVISRADHATIDAGADLPTLDAPFTDEDRRNLEGLLAAYEASDHDDDGEKFKAPGG